MPIPIPTTEQQRLDNISILETNLGQSAPIDGKSLLRVLALNFSLNGTTHFKYGTQQAKENLALTASREGLIAIGKNYGIAPKAAESFQCTATLPATSGTIIPITLFFTGDSNGAQYNLDGQVTASVGDIATLQLTAQDPGSDGNLLVDEKLTISSQIAGVLSSKATITVITNTGADEEDTEAFRLRVLSKIRATPGGANSSDFREWGEAVAGVESVYPYSMRPDQPGGGNPGERTIYVESEPDIDPDGIPPSSLLTEVKAAFVIDPETGLDRQPLGMVESTIFVLPITRTTFYVVITGLDVDPSDEAQVKADIQTSLDTYFRSLSPYISGLDPIESKNNIVTDPTVSAVILDVVEAAGGTFSEVAFNVGASSLPSYELGSGEHAKLSAAGGVTYV